MGLTYGYDIYLPPRNIAKVLAHLAELAPPARAVPPLEITLPGTDRLVLPFTSNFTSDPVNCSTSSTLDLDMSLMFDADDALREYARTSGPGLEADGRVQIGYIYATIRFESLMHPGYASVEFWAATSRMSRLFARSANIRKAFTDLTADSGGVCCLFDTGDGAPEQVCWLNGETGDLLVLADELKGQVGDIGVHGEKGRAQ
ncbi:hypothetical protein YW5DRAFT_05567 [Streptomyces sp. Ncost-T6T-1]|uniref:hypothetical protein n=1 Tax=Streptomyces sp. Ncost-T6T-1 TaxID=1100828 RepID=UPI000805177A|nr:hypothetical protein [Streptomyces sp. Ncost-T6T-1]SBU97572.1 hypothetical protein YW5DRAFT_05567 [Streptomyces sp. Ncost-T6T-1]